MIEQIMKDGAGEPCEFIRCDFDTISFSRYSYK